MDGHRPLELLEYQVVVASSKVSTQFSHHIPRRINKVRTCGDGPPTPLTGPDNPAIGPPGGGIAGIPRPTGYNNNDV